MCIRDSKISTQMVRSVKLDDAYVDQLLTIKQLAWVARNTGGDASVMISNALGGLPLPADAMAQYYSNIGKVETAWAAIEDVASGLPLPAPFWAAVEKGRTEYFGREYTELRTKMLKALVAGEKVDMKVQDWSRVTVSKLAALLGVAEAALDVAKEHAEKQRAIAQRSLWIELGPVSYTHLTLPTILRV